MMFYLQDFPVPANQITDAYQSTLNASVDKLVIIAGIAILVVIGLFLLVIWKGINPFLSLLKSQTEELRKQRNDMDKQREDSEKEIQHLQAQNTETRDALRDSVDALVKISNNLLADVSIIKSQGLQTVDKIDTVNGAIGQIDEKIDHVVDSVDRLTRHNEDTQIAVTLQSVRDELASLKTAVADLRVEVEKRRTNTKPIPVITDEELKAS